MHTCMADTIEPCPIIIEHSLWSFMPGMHARVVLGSDEAEDILGHSWTRIWSIGGDAMLRRM
jgi:hypothetical protein